MRSPGVVEIDVAAQAFACGRDALIGPQIDLLVFDGSVLSNILVLSNIFRTFGHATSAPWV